MECQSKIAKKYFKKGLTFQKNGDIMESQTTNEAKNGTRIHSRKEGMG
jgi:hypothetical protein